MATPTKSDATPKTADKATPKRTSSRTASPASPSAGKRTAARATANSRSQTAGAKAASSARRAQSAKTKPVADPVVGVSAASQADPVGAADVSKPTIPPAETVQVSNPVNVSPSPIPESSGTPSAEVNRASKELPVAFAAQDAVLNATAVPAEETRLTARITDDPSDLADSAEPTPDAAPELTDEESDAASESPVDFDELRLRLMALQQRIRAAKVPVVMVFEGWDASGKGTILSKLIEGLDPRGYQVYPVRKPTEHDQQYPAMRRYWVHMPAGGNISLFCSSWYREVSKACLDNKPSRKRINQRFQEIVSMESQLIASGVLLLKFFLHVSRKEQKRRLKELESHKSTRWRVDKDDWLQNEHYEASLRLYDTMIARTHFEGAVWHVLRSDNRRACVKQVYDIVISAFQSALDEHASGKKPWDTPFLPHLESTVSLTFPPLDTFDPDQALTDPYKPAVDKAQKQLHKLQNDLYRRGIPMVIGFEGWDAAGKGGAIRRLTSSLDPRGFDVVPIASPTPLELSHHYLWRFWREVPRNGHIAIFDRTWYGRVMVERIEGFCTESEWKRAYEEINRFEAELTAHGAILCKFWLQIDRDTQLVRFNEREASPDKQWKITQEDWRNREKWPLYETAVNEMLQKTSTATAPWTVVEANNKQFARLKVLQTVIRAMEIRLAEEHD